MPELSVINVSTSNPPDGVSTGGEPFGHCTLTGHVFATAPPLTMANIKPTARFDGVLMILQFVVLVEVAVK